MCRPLPRPTLFPYTTLFRSGGAGGQPPATGLRRWRARHPLDDLEGGVAAQRGHEEGQRHQERVVGRRKLLAQAGERMRSEEHTSELQSQSNLVCRLLLEKKK